MRRSLKPVSFTVTCLTLSALWLAPTSSGGEVDARDASPRTREAVEALIEKIGSSRPDWWAEVPLDYPKSLDLSWSEPTGPWDPRKNVGQYMWSIINENPSRWRQGTKFMHYVHLLNRKKPEVRAQAIAQLAHCYHDLLEDWARAAYWLRQVKRPGYLQVIQLANCYWKLGSRELATAELGRIRVDRTRYGSAIKLRADMGDLEKALELSRTTAREGKKDVAYMGAGDALRKHGRYEEALGYYRKVVELPSPSRQDALLERNRSRARINIGSIRLFDTLDLEKIPDGVYRGASLAYNGDLTVDVELKKGRITRVRIVSHSDKQYYSALKDTPDQILEKQDLRKVDGTTGATITSEAVVFATARALARDRP